MDRRYAAGRKVSMKACALGSNSGRVGADSPSVALVSDGWGMVGIRLELIYLRITTEE
jgi:hypothetical protein